MATKKSNDAPVHLKQMAKKLSREFQGQIESYIKNYSEIASQVPRGDGFGPRASGQPNAPLGFGLGFKRTDSGRIELVARYYVREKIPAQGISSQNLIPRSVGGLRTDVVELGSIAPIGMMPRRNKRADKPTDNDDGREFRGAGITGGGRPSVSDNGGRPYIPSEPGRPHIRSASLEDFSLQAGLSTAEIKDLAARRSLAPVVGGGYSISPNDEDKYPWAGTLACFVKGKGTKQYVLSNNHVLAGWAARTVGNSETALGSVPVGTPIGQPGFIDDDVRKDIGLLSAALPIQLNGPTNHADVALAELSVSKGEWEPSIRGIGQVVAPVIAPEERYPFQTVMKAGRTTGVTLGLIYDLDANFWLDWEGGEAWFEHQLGIMGTAAQPEFSGPGDSGSLVVDYLTNRAVGLLFAGAEAGLTFVNPIEYVLSAFEKDSKIGPLTIL